jgi:hypothetical protein
MSPTEALKAARAAGIRLEVDGDDLVLEASAPPPPAMLDLLSRNKAGIVTLLRRGGDSWSVEDWRTFFDERTRIASSMADRRAYRPRPAPSPAVLPNG